MRQHLLHVGGIVLFCVYRNAMRECLSRVPVPVVPVVLIVPASSARPSVQVLGIFGNDTVVVEHRIRCVAHTMVDFLVTSDSFTVEFLALAQHKEPFLRVDHTLHGPRLMCQAGDENPRKDHHTHGSVLEAQNRTLVTD